MSENLNTKISKDKMCKEMEQGQNKEIQKENKMKENYGKSMYTHKRQKENSSMHV